MPATKWTPLVLDRRGSIFLPMDYKRISGVQPGSIFLMRQLGDILILAPSDFFMAKQAMYGTDQQKDGVVAIGLNEAWNNPQHAVAPPLFPQAEPVGLTAPYPPVGEGTAVEPLRHLVEVNGKGFVPIPDSLKQAMGGLARGGKVLLEVRIGADSRPLITLDPLEAGSGKITAYLEEKKKEHLRDEYLAARRVELKNDRDKLKEEVEALTKKRDSLVREIQSMRAPTGTPNGKGLQPMAPVNETAVKAALSQPPPPAPVQVNKMTQAEIHAALSPKPPEEKTVASSQSTQSSSEPPKDITLEPGHIWKFQEPFGWIQVPKME